MRRFDRVSHALARKSDPFRASDGLTACLPARASAVVRFLSTVSAPRSAHGLQGPPPSPLRSCVCGFLPLVSSLLILWEGHAPIVTQQQDEKGCLQNTCRNRSGQAFCLLRLIVTESPYTTGGIFGSGAPMYQDPRQTLFQVIQSGISIK